MSEKKHQKPANFSQPYEYINNPQREDDDVSGTGGKGGGETEMRWKDPFAAPTRDDLLPPQEKNRLKKVHEMVNKGLVDKQKQTLAERKLMKEGVRHVTKQQYGQTKGFGSGRGVVSRYKQHPIAKKFNGKIDKQLSPLANENEANTNPELKEQLENRLENKYRNTPKFNPKPRPPG